MARTLQIAINADGNLPVVILAFHNMEYGDEDYALRQPAELKVDEGICKSLRVVRQQLNGRCKGLLEIHGFSVQFLHRTLWDFLKTGEMAAYLSHKAGTGFSASISLLRAYVAFIKRCQIGDFGLITGDPTVIPPTFAGSTHLNDILNTMLSYAGQVENDD
jgi:hypothetical protein